MSSQTTSIQAYFPRKSTTQTSPREEVPASKSHDTAGVDSSEVDLASSTVSHKWQPRTEYTDVDIANLCPGPSCVKVTGRIVNYYEMANTSKSNAAAKGSFKVIVKDDSGAFTVKPTTIPPHRRHVLMPAIGQAVVR